MKFNFLVIIGRVMQSNCLGCIVAGGNKHEGKLSGDNYVKAIYLGSIIRGQFSGGNYPGIIISGQLFGGAIV